jgi:hypothetical protein
MLDLVRAAGLPVVESAPVSMKMAVEEGWYGKSGSKWQTELKQLMLQYRAGSFFGNIHAPDVVMGMGRTTEEVIDISTRSMSRRSSSRRLRLRPPRHRPARLRRPGEHHRQRRPAPARRAVTEAANSSRTLDRQKKPEPLKFAEVADTIAKAGTEIELEAARALIPRVEDVDQQAGAGRPRRRSARRNWPSRRPPASRRKRRYRGGTGSDAMLITHIVAENFIGLRAANVAHAKPVTLFAGLNGAGKSSLQEAVRMALDRRERARVAEEGIPAIVNDGGKQGFAQVVMHDGRRSPAPPSCCPAARRARELHGAARAALRAGCAALRHLDEKERRAFLFGLMGLKTDLASVKERLLKRQLDAAKIERVLPMLRAGFEAASKDAKTKATEAKGAWRALTGETYGAVKAMQRSVDNDKRDLTACDKAADDIKTITEAIGKAPTGTEIEVVEREVEQLQQARGVHAGDLDALRKAKVAADAAEESTKKAKAAHADVVTWDAIGDALAPDGIPGEMLAEALTPINARLAQSALDAEWPLVVIGREMEITAAGRSYNLLSESEKWRADAMVAEAISFQSGLKLLVLDRFDVLDTKGRTDLLAWLDVLATNAEVDTALVFGTLKSLPADLPATVAGEWINNGQVGQERQAA